MLELLIYVIAGVLWGIFSANMQKKIRPYSQPYKIEMVYFLNMIWWPIGMVIAIYNLRTGKHDKYFTGA